MAFDMMISGSRICEKIDHDEEDFLMLIDRHDLKCPILGDVWQSFYRSPRIYPGRTGAIVSELDLIDVFIKETRPPEFNLNDWAQTYQRLRSFFFKAQELEKVVECDSD